jgi:3D (Asp-Asp-Asp) domain-containing protein
MPHRPEQASRLEDTQPIAVIADTQPIRAASIRAAALRRVRGPAAVALFVAAAVALVAFALIRPEPPPAPEPPVPMQATAAPTRIVAPGGVPRRITVVEQVGAASTTTELETTAATVGEALFRAGIPLSTADTFSQPLGHSLVGGETVTVRRAFTVTVEADGQAHTVETSRAHVADALDAAGIVLVGLDYSVPAEDAPIRPGERVRVFRVSERIETVRAPIPYETQLQADANAPLDTRTTLQAGREGVLQTLTRVRLENGIPIARVESAPRVLVAPQDAIIGYGTQIVLRTIDTPEGPREYWRTFRVYATSYHPAALGGDDVTATGRRLQRGIVATDPDLIPYGTNVYVEGYGTGIIADTGGPRNTARWIDLGYSDSDWINWHREVTIYLLTPVPDTIDYFPPP